ncbi:MAG TPA: hypothetical protein VF067_01425 [Sphingomicrobium sp.]
MAVVINEFEASVEPSAGRAEAQQKPAEIKPYEFRRQLRRAALRAQRVRAG